MSSANLLYVQSLLDNLLETKCHINSNYKVFACFFQLSKFIKTRRL